MHEIYFYKKKKKKTPSFLIYISLNTFFLYLLTQAPHVENYENCIICTIMYFGNK